VSLRSEFRVGCRCDFRIKRRSVRLYLQLFVGRIMSYFLFVFACVYWCPTYILLCFCFVFLRLVYLMLPVSLCLSSPCVPYVASFSVFVFALCTLCCQFLCVFLRLVYLMLPVSLCLSSSCVPYVASFSVFVFVLCTLCCQFLCVCLRLVYLMLPVSLDCPFLIASSVFSNVYLLFCST
jgi:hypothetical protein